MVGVGRLLTSLAMLSVVGCGSGANYPDASVKLIASKWGVNGAAACSVRFEQFVERAQEVDPAFDIGPFEQMEQVMQVIRDEVSSQVGVSVMDAAVRKFRTEHADDSFILIQQDVMGCSDDIIRANQEVQREGAVSNQEEWKSKFTAEGRDVLETGKASRSLPEFEQHDADRWTEEDLRQAHTPFAALMDGRWASEGRSCEDSENMIFDVGEGTFERGRRSGTFTFENMLLSMHSDLGDSVGRVTVLEPDLIQIDWVAWKSVRYIRC